MLWKEFADKVSPLVGKDDTIGVLGFKYKDEEYKITSQWGSGDSRQFVNLWAKKVDDTSGRIYPFSAEMVDKLVFFSRELPHV